MNDDIVKFPTKGTSTDDTPGIDDSGDNSSPSIHVSVPQLMHEMLRDGEQHRQQERDLIELEIQDLKRIKIQFLIDLILATCEREKITLKEVLHGLESPRIEE
jgi:hypothetical protein